MEDQETTPTAAGGDRAAHVETILRIHQGFAASQALFTADALGVFDRLAAGPLDLDALAAAVGVEPAPLERLLILCSAVGLLERDGARFRLSDVSAACLVKERPGIRGRSLRPVSTRHVSVVRPPGARAARGAAAVASGAAVREDHALRGGVPRRGFASRVSPGDVQPQLPDRTRGSRATRLLRVSSRRGHRWWDRRVRHRPRERHPGLRGTIFDLPQVEPAAREAIARHGLDDRLTSRPATSSATRTPTCTCWETSSTTGTRPTARASSRSSTGAFLLGRMCR